MHRSYDKPFLVTIIALVVLGAFIFTSASLGLLAKEGPTFLSVARSQILFGLLGGLIAMFITSRIPYTFWKKHAFVILFLAIIGSLLVFIPGLGLEHGGAQRWIDLRLFSFQPSELLKIAFIIYLSAWLATAHKHLHKFAYSTVPFLVIMSIASIILFIQNDIDVIVILSIIGVILLFVSKIPWKHMGVLLLIGILGIGGILLVKPHAIDRLVTFANPNRDSLGASYQIEQALIAIGSGGITGRGFGQSVQKFNFLPEPIGDSIFAVFAEEWGFVGSVVLIALFCFLGLRGLKIATRAPDNFARLLTLGIVILIVMQSLLNIGAMLGVVPLIGTPLLLVSHGGTALFVTLAELGIVLNVTRHLPKQRK